MEILSQVAEGMQDVLTKTADMIGRETGFIKRLRKLSGSGYDHTTLDITGRLLGILRS
jgi:hypothetical protein